MCVRKKKKMEEREIEGVRERNYDKEGKRKAGREYYKGTTKLYVLLTKII